MPDEDLNLVPDDLELDNSLVQDHDDILDDPDSDDLDGADESDDEDVIDDGEGEPEQKSSKGNRAIGKLRAERREAQERAERIEREAQELKQRLAALENTRVNADTAAQQAAENERLQYMSDSERTAYLLDKQQRYFNSQIQNIQFQLADNNDRSAFDSLCRKNPAIERLHSEVERTLQSERAAGRYGANRETIAKFLLGDMVFKRANKAPAKKPAKKNQSQRPVQGGRGDVASPGRQGGKSDIAAIERRLVNIKI